MGRPSPISFIFQRPPLPSSQIPYPPPTDKPSAISNSIHPCLPVPTSRMSSRPPTGLRSAMRTFRRRPIPCRLRTDPRSAIHSIQHTESFLSKGPTSIHSRRPLLKLPSMFDPRQIPPQTSRILPRSQTNFNMPRIIPPPNCSRESPSTLLQIWICLSVRIISTWISKPTMPKETMLADSSLACPSSLRTPTNQKPTTIS